jgi:hypothetical protein
VPLVEQELLTLPEHLSSPPVFSGVHVTWSLVLYVCFIDRCLSFCPFSFGHCVVCPAIYEFWLPLWYLQTLLEAPEYTALRSERKVLYDVSQDNVAEWSNMCLCYKLSFQWSSTIEIEPVCDCWASTKQGHPSSKVTCFRHDIIGDQLLSWC